MITELIIILPILWLCWKGIIPWTVIIIYTIFIYWIPKNLIIKLLEYFYPEIITRNHSQTSIFLTFDDMPYGSHQNIIEILNKHQMKATFFIISEYVNEENIDIFVNAVKMGHQLGNHGKTNSMHLLKSDIELVKEINHCDSVIKDIYRRARMPLPQNMIYRPGCGLFGPSMLNIVSNLGYKIALGSVYPNDAVISSETINYWYLISHLEPGDVVIMHDRKWTPNMLDNLLTWMHTHNLESSVLDKIFR